MPIVKPSRNVEDKLSALRDQARAEHAGEERAAAEEEIRERDERDRRSSVYSVRLPAEVYEVVRDLAEHQHLTPSALIRQWVSERVQPAESDDDLSAAVANLRRDVERLAKLARPA